jgi:uncharacterized membrane protein YbaN (DUF454 family)
MMKALQYSLGIGLIILGIIGLFLPILQGILFIVTGVVILRADSMQEAWFIFSRTISRFKKKQKQ